jgi:hypothetical protein
MAMVYYYSERFLHFTDPVGLVKLVSVNFYRIYPFSLILIPS